jgi:membrane AbrB-like protein
MRSWMRRLARATGVAAAARVVATVVVSVAGGLLGYLSAVPAGALLGAMIAVAGLNLITNGAARLPTPLRVGSRILAGTTIGSLVTATLLGSMGAYLPLVGIFTVLIILVGLACAWLMGRLTGLDKSTTLLACAPGGLPEMTALAQDLGSEVEVVIGLHVLRKVVALVTISSVVLMLPR